MVTVQEVYTLALALMDEPPGDSSRVLSLVETLLPELIPLSEQEPSASSTGCTALHFPEAMTDLVPLDDDCARAVLPWGLGARLLWSEDPELSERMEEQYRLGKSRLARTASAVSEEIDECYGGIEGGNGQW